MHSPRWLLLLVTSLLLQLLASAQKIEWLDSGRNTSLRGLSVVSDKTIWVSGSNGTVGRSIDGGKSWNWTIVPGFEKREFRDIEAFDEQTAIIIAIEEPGQILKTKDGGNSWKIVFTDSSKGMFLDAMDFADNKKGIVVGDPIDGKAYFATTADGGESWTKASHLSITLEEGEAFFASSGTNIRYKIDGAFVLVSGGKQSRLITADKTVPLSLVKGKESTGANSIAVYKKKMVIVGGDFSNEKDNEQNCLVSKNAGNSFSTPATPPAGYRSCVEFISKNKLIACGLSGVDVSSDRGNHWQTISNDGFHVCRKAKNGKAVFLAGRRGRIARLDW